MRCTKNAFRLHVRSYFNMHNIKGYEDSASRLIYVILMHIHSIVLYKDCQD